MDQPVAQEQLISKTPKVSDEQGTVGHWSRSDGLYLTAPKMFLRV